MFFTWRGKKEIVFDNSDNRILVIFGNFCFGIPIFGQCLRCGKWGFRLLLFISYALLLLATRRKDLCKS